MRFIDSFRDQESADLCFHVDRLLGGHDILPGFSQCSLRHKNTQDAFYLVLFKRILQGFGSYKNSL